MAGYLADRTPKTQAASQNYVADFSQFGSEISAISRHLRSMRNQPDTKAKEFNREARRARRENNNLLSALRDLCDKGFPSGTAALGRAV
jgi:hypothetical protein